MKVKLNPITTLIFIFFQIFCNNLYAQSNHSEYVSKLAVDKESYLPGRSVRKEVFERVLNAISDIYTPIFEKSGYILIVSPAWDSQEMNASLARFGSVPTLRLIQVLGGLARYPNLTEDGIALVMCHEVGHQLGGQPLQSNDLISSEGQSDYFAATKCLRKYFKTQRNSNEVVDTMMFIPSIVTQKCQEVWGKKTSENYAICVRTSMAGYHLATFLAKEHRMPADPNDPHNTERVKVELDDARLDLPDLSENLETNFNDYPDAQCRLDTFFQGALCKVSEDEQFSYMDASIGACNDYTQPGARPRCWYNPTQSRAPYEFSMKYTL